MLRNVSTPHKPALTLRQNGSPWQSLCTRLCLLESWCFLPGFPLRLSQWPRRVGAAVMFRATDEWMNEWANEWTSAVWPEKNTSGCVGQAKRKRDCESSSPIWSHVSRRKKPEFGQLAACHHVLLPCGVCRKWNFVHLIEMDSHWKIYFSVNTRFLLFILCRIKHANIVSLEEIFESKSHLYLVMQLWVFVCGSVWFSFSSHASTFFLPHTECHINCGLQHTCRYIWQVPVNAREHCASPAHEHQWGSSASHLQPVTSTPTVTQTEMSKKKERLGSGTLLTAPIMHSSQSIENQRD